ncbi:MAG: cell division protein FtsZ, partial [Muribaculaceae bacterium]|nr:cell division protein FtsZ [Muribaculaceae bacterium]
VKMVFVTAGMGGGTGTGGAPIVAKVAKERGILTVGIVTIPFFFEGMNKINMALNGAALLQENVDALLVINNDKLSQIYPDMRWDMAFSKADDILTTAAQTISDMVTTLANINIDMRDVDTCLRNGRTALISVGYGEGKERMSQAIQSALHSPLLCDTDIMSAKELLFAFYYSPEIDPPFLVSEAAEANRLVQEINKHVHIKFGWGYDSSLGNKIKFTILASGFDMSVEAGGISIKTIEGRQNPGEEAMIDQRIASAYGKDKVEELLRRQETQNFYILGADQLDSDEAIELLERTPTFKRDKRKAANGLRATDRAITADTRQNARTNPQTAQPAVPGQRTQTSSNPGIIFSLDDRD